MRYHMSKINIMLKYKGESILYSFVLMKVLVVYIDCD
jgi:hypothetical protein